MPSKWQHDLFDASAGGNRRSAGAGGLSTGTKLHISNLDFGVSESDIQVLLHQCNTTSNITDGYIIIYSPKRLQVISLVKSHDLLNGR